MNRFEAILCSFCAILGVGFIACKLGGISKMPWHLVLVPHMFYIAIRLGFMRD